MANKRQVKKNLKKYGQKTKGKNRKNQREPSRSIYVADPQQQRMDAVGFPPLEGPGDR